MPPSGLLRRAAGVSLATLATVGLTLGGPDRAWGQSRQEWRIATLAPEGSPTMRSRDSAAKQLSERTEGRITLRYFAGSTQADERDVVRQMGLGQLDGAELSGPGLAMIEPSIRVLELPRLFASTAELDYVRDKVWPHFARKFAAKGYVLAAAGDGGDIQVVSQTPIQSLDDLHGAKLWQPDDEISRAFFRQLGAAGVPLGLPDVPSGLAGGRLTAACAPPAAILALQWTPHARHLTALPLSRGLMATVIRQDVWDLAGKADRTAAATFLKAAYKTIRKQVRKDQVAALKTLNRRGVATVTPQPDLVNAVDAAAAHVADQLAGTVYSRQDLDLVRLHRARHRDRSGTPESPLGKE